MCSFIREKNTKICYVQYRLRAVSLFLHIYWGECLQSRACTFASLARFSRRADARILRAVLCWHQICHSHEMALWPILFAAIFPGTVYLLISCFVSFCFLFILGSLFLVHAVNSCLWCLYWVRSTSWKWQNHFMQICQLMRRACCGNNLFSIFISNSYQNKLKSAKNPNIIVIKKNPATRQ